MSKKFNLEAFLNKMQDENRYVCIDEIIYTWNGNC